MMEKKEIKKTMIRAAPYIFVGLLSTNIGEAVRMTEGWNVSEKVLDFMKKLPEAFANPVPSFYPLDLLVGGIAALLFYAVVKAKGRNQKKYRPGVEYGSARWGTHRDIEPFEDPVFKNNVILTKTERLMMSNRPKNPKFARNKNVLIIGGSGSGKTRFWLKPNLLQMHSSYVVTDPKV